MRHDGLRTHPSAAGRDALRSDSSPNRPAVFLIQVRLGLRPIYQKCP